MRPEMTPKFLITLLFIAGEMKYTSVLGVFGVKEPIKNCKEARRRSGDQHGGGKNAGIY